MFAVAAVMLASCATPYAPDGLIGGFEVKDLGQDVYRVSFQGNGYTTRETVQTYWLYHCSQLALEKGFNGFEILSDLSFVMRHPAEPLPRYGFAVTTPDSAGLPAAPHEVANASPRGSVGAAPAARPPGERVAAATPVFIYSGGGGGPKPGIEADVHFIRRPVESMPPKVFNAKALHAALEPIVKAEKCSIGNVCPHVHEYLLPKGKLQ